MIYLFIVLSIWLLKELKHFTSLSHFGAMCYNRVRLWTSVRIRFSCSPRRFDDDWWWFLFKVGILVTAHWWNPAGLLTASSVSFNSPYTVISTLAVHIPVMGMKLWTWEYLSDQQNRVAPSCLYLHHSSFILRPSCKVYSLTLLLLQRCVNCDNKTTTEQRNVQNLHYYCEYYYCYYEQTFIIPVTFATT